MYTVRVYDVRYAFGRWSWLLFTSMCLSIQFHKCSSHSYIHENGRIQIFPILLCIHTSSGGTINKDYLFCHSIYLSKSFLFFPFLLSFVLFILLQLPSSPLSGQCLAYRFIVVCDFILCISTRVYWALVQSNGDTFLPHA